MTITDFPGYDEALEQTFDEYSIKEEVLKKRVAKLIENTFNSTASVDYDIKSLLEIDLEEYTNENQNK